MARRVEHHSVAHFGLTIVLFLLAVWVFGGWTRGPLTDLIITILPIFGVFRDAKSGSLASASAGAGAMVGAAIMFVINLIVFYLCAAIIIFIYNLFFGD